MKTRSIPASIVLSICVILSGLTLGIVLSSTVKSADVVPSKFEHVTLSGAIGGFWLFDRKTGEVWVYEKTRVERVGKLVEVGQPLVR